MHYYCFKLHSLIFSNENNIEVIKKGEYVSKFHSAENKVKSRDTYSIISGY